MGGATFVNTWYWQSVSPTRHTTPTGVYYLQTHYLLMTRKSFMSLVSEVRDSQITGLFSGIFQTKGQSYKTLLEKSLMSWNKKLRVFYKQSIADYTSLT